MRRARLLVLVLGLSAALVGVVVLLRPVPHARDVPMAAPLSAGDLEMVVFGTSLSARAQIWPERVAQRLQACREAPVTLTRIAGPGKGSDWALAQLSEVIAARPDLLLIEFAINDADMFDGQGLKAARRAHGALLHEVQSALPKTRIVLLTMNPAQGARGWTRPRLGAHYRQYHALAQAFGTGLLDLYPRWLALPRAARGLERDGLHPDPEVAAELVAPMLARYLGCASPRS